MTNDQRRRKPEAPAIQKTKLSLAVASAVFASAVIGSANAQVLTIEEVSVTATKREESVQDVPLAITALSGDFTQKVNINDVKDLVAFTPGVTGNSQDSFIDAISLRGIRTQDFGIGGDPSAAFFKNDLYEGRNGSAVTSVYDMERSEILRGPQGFLFGRNSIGGAFSVHTRKAEIGDDTTGYIETDVAQRGHFAVEGAVNLPVNDNFAMRLAAYSSQEDGFVKNYYPGSGDLIEHNKKAVRWSTTYESDQLTVNTTAEFEDRKQSGSVYRAIEEGEIWENFEAAVGDVNLRGGRGDVDSDQTLGDNDNAKVATFGIHVEYDFGELVLTSNTGYKDHDYFYTEDYDGTPLNVLDYQQEQTGDYFQQEFRLASNSDGPLAWYTGVSYYKEEIDTEYTFASSEDIMCQYYGHYYTGMNFSGCADLYTYYGSPFSPSADGRLIETGRAKGSYSGWATYVDLDYAITDALSLGVGVRYTKDHKDFAIGVPTPESDLGAYWAYGFSTAGFLSDSDSWGKLTSRAIAKYQFDDGGLLFASFTEGYKSGGFGTFNLSNDANGNPAVGNVDIAQGDGFAPNKFAPELIDSWEIGYKNSLFDGRANFDVSAFTYEYTDLQVVVPDGGGAIIKNVGNVNAHGVESSITAMISDNFNVLFNFGWMDSEATGIQGICASGDDACEGSPLFWAPEWSGAMVLDAHFPLGAGMLTSSLEVFWEGERGGGWEGLDTTVIDPYQDLTLRVGYESDSNWRVDAYAENLTNEFTWDGLNNNGGVLTSHFFGPKRPRTLGLRFGMDFD
ncbi:TonB-dependent receptor [Microbulbifer marinus]|uniref:Iron complex outermembrane recepter protein n=1 Tax=Microbulbifer marinus TaxID=658218 RepID=A0A1H3Z555_9GAMM|nr:TonB-dependent receptor [Microbulbifer marinus]SEA18790.1 iron complex outermembrane recepter protein [Microbulbifer marinus]